MRSRFPLTHSLRCFSPALLLAALLYALLAYLPAGVGAQTEGQTHVLHNPSDLSSPSQPVPRRDVTKRLAVKYLSTTVPNPGAPQPDQVRLRVYAEPDSPGALIGPTIRVRPGDTLRLRLDNQLPPDKCVEPEGTHNIPSCFNTTNMHTHGWHVSPTGNSDNVLLEITPGTSFDYEFQLPVDHPAGTFWYHSHKHGSTALQVSSGMEGALIVEGNRPLKLERRGAGWARVGEADVDTILKDREGPVAERLLVFQQLAYSCKDEWGNFTWNCAAKNCSIPRKRDADGKLVGDCTGQWRTRVGVIESYNEQQFGLGTWQTSGRFTLINGEVQPLIEARAGKIERWRMIHAGVQDTINLRITKSTYTGAPSVEPEGLLHSTAEQEGWVGRYCGGRDVQQLEFAVDGLTRQHVTGKTQNVLQPGYRSDALVAFPEPGYYCVLDDALSDPKARIKSDNNLVDDRRLLGLVYVAPGTNVPWDGQQQYVLSTLLDTNKDLPQPALDALRQMDISFFAPHEPIPASAVSGQQSLVFSIDGTPPDLRFGVNHQGYSPDRIDRLVQLDEVDDWTLQSISLAGHPFHIHVNPFQVVDVLKYDPARKVWGSLFALSYDECLKEEKGDPQYCDQKDVFRDTLFVKPGDSTGVDYRVIVRTRYERYIGDFVLHCHILDHEDFGMMQNVRIAPKAVEGATPVQASGHGRGGHH
jgi:FtsP/CotA-like multicopper oxidase with cupredoxin domain